MSTPLPCLDCFLIIPTSLFLRLGEFMINLMISPPPTQYFTIWSLKLCLLLSASISLSWKHSLYKPTALLLPKGSRQCWEVVTSQGDILLPWSAELASPPSPRLSYEVIHYHGFGHRVMDSAVFHANSSQMTTLSRRYRCSYYPHFVEEDTESQQS